MKALKLKNVNFYERYNENPQRAKIRKLRLRLALPIIAVVAALAVIVIMLNNSIMLLQAQIEEKENIIYGSEAEMAGEVQEMSGAQTVYYNETQQLEYYKKAVASYREADSAIFDMIFSCTSSDIIIGNYSYAMPSGSIQFSATSRNVNSIPEFIAKLRGQEEFLTVVYVGYSGSTADGYSFNVGCVFNGTMDNSEFSEYIVSDTSTEYESDEDYSYLEAN